MRLLKSSALVLTLKVIGALGGYAFALIAVRYFGTDGYGRFELAFTIVTLLAVVAKWGYDGVLLKEIPARAARGEDSMALVRSIRTWVWVASMCLALLLYTFSEHVALFFDSPSMQMELEVGSFLLVFWAVMMLQAEIFRAQGKMLLYGMHQSSFILGIAAITIFVSVPYFGLEPKFLQLTPISLFLLVPLVPIIIMDRWDSWRNWKIKPAGRKVVRKTARAMFLSGILFMVMSWSDTLMLGYFMSDSDVGVYRIAFRVATLITFTQFAVNAGVAPDIAKLWAEGKRDVIQASIQRIFLLNFLIAVPAFLVLTLGGEFFMGLFGLELREYADIMRWLCIGQVVNALCGPVMYLLNMTGHEDLAKQTMLIAVVFNLAANLYLIPNFGLAGAAWATSASMILWNVWALVLVYRRTGIQTVGWR